MDYSFAIFGPQGAAPSVSYLKSISDYISRHPVLKCIKEEIKTLQDVLSLVSAENSDIAALPQAPKYMDYFFQWLLEGKPDNIADVPSTITALPRLCIIHLVQYFQFLENQNLNHADFVAHTKSTGGGFQGYCGGMPATAALSSAKKDQELAQNIITAIRLAFAIGLYTELGDDTRVPGLAIMVVRVDSEEQAHDLVSRFPGTYISAFTDPRNISVVGPTGPLTALKDYATEQGFLVQPLEIRGKVHNPENIDLAHELSGLVAKSSLLRLPMGDQLHCPARSNRDGQVIPADQNLSDDVLYTVLASRSEWYKVLEGVAEAVAKTGREKHNCISLGIGDFIPLMPFNKLGLRIKKIEWSGDEAMEETPEMAVYEYPEDAIAIVGSSCRLPGANNLHELWQILSTGQDRHEEVPASRANIQESFRAGQSGKFAKNRKWYGNFIDSVDCFDRAFFGMNAREMANMDPQQRLLLELAYEAMESYGYTKSHVRLDGDNVGCFIGASFTEYLENAYAHAPTAYTAPGTIRAFLCGRISYHFGWTGPSEVIDTACSASLVAVHRAVKAIRSGECPVAIAGGVNLISGVHNYLDLARAGFLSATGQCKPWDVDADGYCRSDGVGLVVLKSLKQAQADGDRIMAVIAGAATNQGGLSSSITNPDPVQQARLYRNVLGQAAMTPEQVTYVEAHGTGTQAGDKLETTSLRQVFGSPTRAAQLTIGSIKGNIGHCETAAGIAGLLKVLSMLEYGSIPPQANHRTWNPKIQPLEPDGMTVSKSLQSWNAPFRAALVNSFGAAGSNATVICCEPPKSASPIQQSRAGQAGIKYPIALSAESTSSIKTFRRTLSAHLSKSLTSKRPLRIEEVAYTLSEKRRRHKQFATLEASDTQELAQLLLCDDKVSILETPKQKKPVVLIFGGQSKQTVGLARGLYEQFSAFRSNLDICSNYLLERGYPSILPAVFQSDENLNDIVALQTGHVAVQYAAARTWIEAGIEVDAVIGHSLGEISALAISGKLSIYDTLDLAAQRALLMKKNWGSDPGSMLAVFATREVVKETLAKLAHSGEHQLEIACYNSAASQVVSGAKTAAAAYEDILKQQSIKFVRVDTSHGFHSRLCEPILEELDQVAAGLKWRESLIPVETCTSSPSASDAEYKPSAHAREPVFFAEAVRRLEEKLGGAIWLEAGFDTPIMGMLKRALGQPAQNELVAGTTKEVASAANLISRNITKLWSNAVPVTHWSFLGQDSPLTAVWLPPYAFDRTTAWLDNIDRTTELQREFDDRPQTSEASESPTYKTLRLVMPLSESEQDRRFGVKRFRVATEGVRFQTIVAGHAVRGRPLCPASVYLECAAMALQHNLGEQVLRKSSLTYEDLDISAPLGLDPEQQVEVVLSELPASQGSQYHFSLVSQHPMKPGHESTHAQGRLVLSQEASVSKLDVMARLVENQLKVVESSVGAERMLSGRVYKLFSRVVEYGNVLKGISSMAVNGTEAMAHIVKSPESRPGASETTVLDTCDAVALDAFIQVAGLNMNTSDAVGVNEVMICNGIDSSIVAQGFDFERCNQYQVYTSYSLKGKNQAVGDVFAWSTDGRIAAAFLGCKFTKLSIGRLEKALDAANKAASPATVVVEPQTVKPESGLDSGYNSRGPASEQGDAVEKASTPAPEASAGQDIRALLETYTGVPASKIASDAIIQDLGVDSLAASELVGELQTNDGRRIPGDELLAMTVQQLEERIGTSSAPVQPAVTSTKVETTAPSSPPAPVSAPRAAPTQTKASSQPKSAPAPPAGNKIIELLVETTGLAASAIDPAATLSDVGVDSLALSEILSALQDTCRAEFDTKNITIESQVQAILEAVAA